MKDENPFVKRPIDVANDEIRNLKRQIAILKSELTLMKSNVKPLIEDLHKRRRDEEEKDKELVMVADTGATGWFW
jgi:chromosome segregation ATPase